MEKYIGYIVRRKSFFNFFPQYKLENGKISEIYNVRDKYPQVGGISLWHENKARSAATQFLFDLNTLTADNTDIADIRLYVVSFSEDELESNNNPNYKRKLDLEKIVGNGEDLNSRIEPAVNYGIYKKGVELSTSELWDIIPVKDNYFENGEKIILEHNSNFYGPLALRIRSIDVQANVNPKEEDEYRYYTIKRYEQDRNVSFKVEISPDTIKSYTRYEDVIIYINAVYICSQPVVEDYIPESVLLESLSTRGSIDAELLSSDPNEFLRMYRSSQFLNEKVPADIRQKRLERVKNILTSAEQYEEQKRKIFISLIESADEELLEKIGEKIKESKAYKDLDELTKSLQKDKEKSEEEKAELVKEKEELENQLQKAQNSDSEDISKLKAEIEVLNKKAEKYQKIGNLDEEAGRLKNEISWLEKEIKEKDEEIEKKDDKIKDKDKKLKEKNPCLHSVANLRKESRIYAKLIAIT